MTEGRKVTAYRSPSGRYEFRHWREDGGQAVAWSLLDAGEEIACGDFDPDRWTMLGSEKLPEIFWAPDEGAMAVLGYGSLPLEIIGLPDLRVRAEHEDFCDVREAWVDDDAAVLVLREWDYIDDRAFVGVRAFDLRTGEELAVEMEG